MLAKFGDITTEYQSVNASKYVRHVDSIEYYGVDRVTKNENEAGKPISFDDKGVPDVWRIGVDGKRQYDHVPLTEDLQHWIFRINVEIYRGAMFANENEYRAYWKTLLKSHQYVGWFTSVLRGNGSHTNRAGFGNKPTGNIPARNYISGENMENGLPKFFHIVTGRWVAKKSRDVTKIVSGAKCLPVEVINISKSDYRNFHPFTHPHLFDRPLITGRNMVKDPKGGVKILSYFRAPYSQFGNLVTLPVMLPFDSEGWIPVDRIVEPSDAESGKKFF